MINENEQLDSKANQFVEMVSDRLLGYLDSLPKLEGYSKINIGLNIMTIAMVKIIEACSDNLEGRKFLTNHVTKIMMANHDLSHENKLS